MVIAPRVRLPMMRQSSSGSFSKSLHAVVDHDGNHADGDGDGQHASRDNPDARNPVVDDGAIRARGFAGNLRRSSIPTAAGGLKKRDRLPEVANAFGQQPPYAERNGDGRIGFSRCVRQ